MPRKPKQSAKQHLPPDVRKEICHCYYSACNSVKKCDCLCRGLPSLDRGPDGDAALDQAFNEFCKLYVENGALRACRRPLSKNAFLDALNYHWPKYSRDRKCPTASRKKAVNLTADQARELFELITTPVLKNGSYERYTSITDASEKNPEVKKLMKKSRAGEDALFHYLQGMFPSLRRVQEDVVPRMPPGTLQKRQECAKIMSGRKPWLERVPYQAGEEEGGGTAGVPGKTGVHVVRGRPRPEQPVFWDPKYYSELTFVIDATTFTNCCKEPKPKQESMVLVDKEHVYGPKLVERDTSIAEEEQLMVYAAIHKHFGLVAGPCIFCSGTRLSLAKRRQTERPRLARGVRRLPPTKSQLLAEANVSTWYAVYTHA